MERLRSVAAYGVAVSVPILVSVLLLFGGRLAAQRPPVPQNPPPFRAPAPAPPSPPASIQTPAPTKGAVYQLPQVAPPALSADLIKSIDADEQINIRVYAAVNRSVVNITTANEAGGFFGEETSSGTGSGFVIDPQGYILTNYHVVEGAESVQVTLYDGSTHEAEVIGVDASNDVAVVRV